MQTGIQCYDLWEEVTGSNRVQFKATKRIGGAEKAHTKNYSKSDNGRLGGVAQW
jgi:hypothetical protein